MFVGSRGLHTVFVAGRRSSVRLCCGVAFRCVPSHTRLSLILTAYLGASPLPWLSLLLDDGTVDPNVETDDYVLLFVSLYVLLFVSLYVDLIPILLSHPRTERLAQVGLRGHSVHKIQWVRR